MVTVTHTRAASELAHRAIEEAKAVLAEGTADAPERAVERIARSVSMLLDRVGPQRARALAASMVEAVSVLSRAPRGETGASLRAFELLEGALRAVIADAGGEREVRP